MAKATDAPQYKAIQHSIHNICKDLSKQRDAIPQLANDLQGEGVIAGYKSGGTSPYAEASNLVTAVLVAVEKDKGKFYVFADKLKSRGFVKVSEKLLQECIELGGSGTVSKPDAPKSESIEKTNPSVGFDGKLFKDKYEYEMSGKAGHGVALVINNKEWLNGKRRTRHGSEVDVENFRKTVEKLNYTAIVKTDLTKDQMIEEVENAGKSITKDHDSFICCIMSHGDNQGIEGVDIGMVSVEELALLVGPEKCPNLVNKPKIFILQACRGQELTQQVVYDDTSEPTEEPEPEPEEEIEFDSKSMAIPPGADYLFAYCTTPRTRALRNTVKGAFYMQVLCDKLCKKAGTKMSLYEIILRVHDKLATDDMYMYADQRGNVYRQMGQVVSTLRKKVYFK